MFDAIVIAGAEAEPAARTLGALVEGVVEGSLRRVVLAGAADAADLRKLADAAGCRAALGIAAGSFGAALSDHVGTPHVLLFTAGALAPPGWADALRQEIVRRGVPPAAAGIAFRPASLPARLGLSAAISLHRRLPLDHGVLAPRGAVTAKDFDGGAIRAGPGWRMTAITVAR